LDFCSTVTVTAELQPLQILDLCLALAFVSATYFTACQPLPRKLGKGHYHQRFLNIKGAKGRH